MEAPPPAKRLRLSMACNTCRRRKVKCDAEYPKCHNCRVRNDDCVTEDAKQPGISIRREWVESQAVPQPLPTTRTHYSNEPTAATTFHVDERRQSCTSQRNGDGIDQGALGNVRNTQIASPSSPLPSTSSASGVSNSASLCTSHAQQPFHVSINLDHSTSRLKVMGGSSTQTLAKSLDLYFKSANARPMSDHFMYGMRHAEEFPPPRFPTWQPLPDAATCNAYLDKFSLRFYSLYPIFHLGQFRNDVKQLMAADRLEGIPAEQVPVLASAYLVMSLCADEGSRKSTNDGDRYLKAAAGLLGHVVFMPYLASVQCLLMFTIVFRGRNQEGVGWETLGIAIRISHTLGLHRSSYLASSPASPFQTQEDKTLFARLWAICCTLEKTIQMETGRPSAIPNLEQDPAWTTQDYPQDDGFLWWSLGLANFQHAIGQHIYGHKPGTRSASQLLSDTARLDQDLLAWTNAVPVQYRPGTEILCSNSDFHYAAFLSIQYNQALIALHRAALIAPVAEFQAEVSIHCQDNPSHYRLKNGQSICVNSARAIARLTIELEDRGINSRVLNVAPCLLACVVLAIYLMKTSSPRTQGADLELLKACAQLTFEHCQDSGMDSRFAQGILSISDQVAWHIKNMSDRPLPRRDSTASRLHASIAQTNNIDMNTTQIASQRTSIQTSTMPTLTTRPSSSGPQDSPTFPLDHSNKEATTYTRCRPSELTEDGPLLGEEDTEQFQRAGEEAMPFSGLNIEELWNWMLAEDTGMPSFSNDPSIL
ncbi:hypothetical protein CEP53_008234 [Fusarium sp. AF-6]|nr:hypothetical protein CEP53_008234 [Fusarium sp. AF-6]